MLVPGLERVKSRRSWVVKNVSVWGLPKWASVDFAAFDLVGSGTSIYFGTGDIGDSVQRINYAELTDHRGNGLPATLNSPVVIVKPRSSYGAYLIGEERATDFVVARDETSPEAVPVDLYIVEMGA